MDSIHKLLNFLLPLLTLISIIFIFPALSLFKLFNYYFRYVFPEKLAGKVVLITGASSGIGEHLAYEYAKRGACLSLIARREKQLEIVAEKARTLGSPDVIVILADVSKIDDCKRFVDETVRHFGTLDHLINNAGIATQFSFQDQKCASDYASILDINFWGSVYTTQCALPHLQKSKGKITVISSCSGWFGPPRLSLYGASKAALTSFFETLQIEVGSDIGITIVTPGIVKSSITDDEWLSQGNMKWVPMEATELCAEAIVNSSMRGDRYLTEPAWMNALYVWKMLCPEVLSWTSRFLLITRPKLLSGNTQSRDQPLLTSKSD